MILRLLATLISIFLVSCDGIYSTGSRKPTVIIVAIESLNYELAPCLEDEKEGNKSGLAILCKEALRLTHIYTPTTMSQGAFASLFTGQKPENHRVFHNGRVSLAQSWDTLAEKAVRSGVQTAFFSGGPPILSKSGLSQGFEVFDDEFLLKHPVYRAADDNLAATFKWLKSLNGQSGLVVSYLPDLQFPFVKTFSEEGREREQSFMAQKQAVDEALAKFFEKLKEQGLWDSSYIIVTGLNGYASAARPGILWRENLFRENVHIPFFIKAPKSENVQAATIDNLLSLEDMYYLLTQLVEGSLQDGGEIAHWIERIESRERKYIEIRSDWRNWWFGQPGELSLRTYDYLIFPTEKLTLFHTLVDKTESIPLSEEEVGEEALRWLEFRISDSYDRSSKVNTNIYDFIQDLHKEIFQNQSTLEEAKFTPADSNSFKFLVFADQAVRQGNWQELLSKASDKKLLKYVAKKNLGEKGLPRLTGECDVFFKQGVVRVNYSSCADPLFVSLLEWEKSRGTDSESVNEKQFMRKYRFYMRYKRMAYLNLITELNWDVDVSTLVGPSRAELYLSLPSKQALSRKIKQYQVPVFVDFTNIN